MGLLPTGVTVVTASGPDGPAGATANAVSSLSIEPMLMLACLDRGSRTLLAVQAAGRPVVTVEGLSERPEFKPLLEAFVALDGGQCGYCTPGMIMSAKALLDENPQPTREEIIHHMDGNICRCTGYVPIVAAIQRAAGMMSKESKK